MSAAQYAKLSGLCVDYGVGRLHACTPANMAVSFE